MYACRCVYGCLSVYYVQVYRYVCQYIYVYGWICVIVSASLYVCMYGSQYVSVHVCIPIYLNVRAYVCAPMSVCWYMYLSSHLCISLKESDLSETCMCPVFTSTTVFVSASSCVSMLLVSSRDPRLLRLLYVDRELHLYEERCGYTPHALYAKLPFHSRGACPPVKWWGVRTSRDERVQPPPGALMPRFPRFFSFSCCFSHSIRRLFVCATEQHSSSLCPGFRRCVVSSSVCTHRSLRYRSILFLTKQPWTSLTSLSTRQRQDKRKNKREAFPLFFSRVE